jgi:hypothetical protein
MDEPFELRLVLRGGAEGGRLVFKKVHSLSSLKSKKGGPLKALLAVAAYW